MPNAWRTTKCRADFAGILPTAGNDAAWNSHPKVYLPLEATGKAKRPYCGADFVLVDLIRCPAAGGIAGAPAGRLAVQRR
ncbi:MAG: hypothetical protein R3F44_01400 [Candidatus Competibacteraceae bacterium]